MNPKANCLGISVFFVLKVRFFTMKKLKMKATKSITFEEGCNKYLEYSRQRNLRQVTINHYRQSYVHFFKFFDLDTPIEEIDEDAYKRYS